MKVKVLRGISGSGKSTYIKTHYPTAIVCSADDFFMINGEYHFNPSLLGKAHEQCFKYFLLCLEDKKPLIAIDNTNLEPWTFAGYVQVARAYGYEVEIVRLEVDQEVAGNRNLHGVPLSKVKQMAKGLVPCPKQLGEETIIYQY